MVFDPFSGKLVTTAVLAAVSFSRAEDPHLGGVGGVDAGGGGSLLQVWSVASDEVADGIDQPPQQEYKDYKDADGPFPHRVYDYSTTADEEVLFHFALAIVWFTICLTSLLAICCCPPPSRADLIEELVAELHRLTQASQELNANISTKQEEFMGEKDVGGLQESFNYMVQRFKDFLETLQANPARLGGEEADTVLASSFAMLVNQWLAVLQECTRDPVSKPLTVVPEEDIRACVTVTEVCVLALSKLKDVTVDLCGVAGQSGGGTAPMELVLSPFKEDDEGKLQKTLGGPRRSNTWFQFCALNANYNEDPVRKSGNFFPVRLSVGLAKTNLLTCRHSVLILLFLMGFCLCTYMLLSDMVCAIICLVGQCLILILLLRFEGLDTDAQQRYVIAQLTVRQQVLKRELAGLGKTQQDVESFCGSSSDRIVKFWRCRTEPQMMVLKAIHGVIRSTRWPNCGGCKAFMDYVAGEIDNQQAQLGEYALWLGEAPKKKKKKNPKSQAPRLLTLRAFDLFKDELDRCALLVKSNGAKAIMSSRNAFQVLNFVAVRVLACSNLPPGDFLDPLEPFVRLRIGDFGNDPEDWLQTTPVEMTVDTDNTSERRNPRWHYEGRPSEFHMNPAVEVSSPLEVEVMDMNDHGDDEMVGWAEVKYQTLDQGTWVSLTQDRRVQLSNVDPVLSGGPSEVELELWVATKAENLVGISPMEPEPPPPAPPKPATEGAPAPETDEALPPVG